MEWPLVRLDSLYSIARGGSPRPINKFITDDPEGINWIKIGDATASGKYIFETKQKIIPEGIQRSRLVDEGDFILSNSMSFGRPYIMGTPGCIHDGWLVLKAKDKSIDQDFLYHILGSQFIFQQFDSLAAGSTVRNLNIDLVSGVKIPLIPLPEQKRIVAILDQAFADIDKARANAEQNLKNVRELFENCLNERLLAICSKIPKQTLSCITDLIVDCEHKTAPTQDEGFPSIRTPNIGKGELILDNVRRVSKKTYELWTKRAVPQSGDLILAREAPAGNVGVIPSREQVCLGQRTVLIRPMSNIIDSRYLAFLLLHPIMQNRLLAYSTGATVQHVNMKDIRQLAISELPRIDQQRADVDALLKTKYQVSLLEQVYSNKLKSLDELKKSILQKAFTGQLTTDKNQNKGQHAA